MRMEERVDNGSRLNNFSLFNAGAAARAADEFGTPVYVYDEEHIIKRCRECTSMPNAYGLTARYAMKANSSKALLRLIAGEGLSFDASSLNEVIRANLAGIPFDDIMLTTQEVYEGESMAILERFLMKGLKYNICSLRQLALIGDFMSANGFSPGIRIHPGVGAGESATRNTGDDYSCFGVHLSDISQANDYMAEKGMKFRHVHEHIGSGGAPDIWRQNIDLELSIIEASFPDADTVSFGGGLKEARMPADSPADVGLLGLYAKTQIEAFYGRTGRKLKMEIEPGTYIIANSGYAVTRVLDTKSTARSNFIITDGGMEINSRPLLYGSQHPVYIVSGDGSSVMSSEFHDRPDVSGESFTKSIGSGGGSFEKSSENDDGEQAFEAFKAVIAGKCCESGDCQTLDKDGHAVPRPMADADAGDIVVIGGVGAYCSSMAPFNYNSHTQAPEVLYTAGGELLPIRRRQTLEQMLENEL